MNTAAYRFAVLLCTAPFLATGCTSVTALAGRATAEVCALPAHQRDALRVEVDALSAPNHLRVYCAPELPPDLRILDLDPQ